MLIDVLAYDFEINFSLNDECYNDIINQFLNFC